jgi:hypothetical protein
MNEKMAAPQEIIPEERLQKIWDNAYDQDREGKNKQKGDEFRAILDRVDRTEAFDMLRSSLERMADFEALADADRTNNLKISPEVAEKIGSIWLFSGVGTYDKRIKDERIIDGRKYDGDNPAFADKPFMLGSNRRRILQGVWLARRIAEARSGKTIEPASIENLHEQREAIKKLIAEYGPYIIFGGYPIENIEAEELLDQERTVMPKEKVRIATRPDGIPMATTTDQLKYFESPQEVQDMDIAFVSDGTHLNRILHIAGKFPEHLPKGKPVNLFPSQTPDTGKNLTGEPFEHGRENFADMEAQGLLAYYYNFKVAEKEPYPYTAER